MDTFLKTVYLLLIFLVFNAPVRSQHFLEGRWEGNYSDSWIPLLSLRKLVVQLNISADTIVTGSSHLYYNSNNYYEHYVINGKYRPKDSTIYFSEDSVLSVRSMMGYCRGNYSMKLSTRGNFLRFDGRWEENPHEKGCGNFGVWLQKRLPPDTATRNGKDCFESDTAGQDRKNLQQLIYIQKLIELDKNEKDSIKIEIADNAEVDGDVVSVYLNHCRLLYKYKLTKESKVIYFSIPENISICNLRMVSESMGSIPPCTALFKITTRKNIYEVNLSSNMNRNSVLQFFLKD